jgi:hypothetical protein
LKERQSVRRFFGRTLGFEIEQRVHGLVATHPKESAMTQTTQNLPATRNEGWGFYGTMNEHAEAAWPLALIAVADATGESIDTVRVFLDSRFGRHFADDVLNALDDGQRLPDAINAATRKWMAWTIGRKTSLDYGIPRSLPYLTGFVIHCGIIDEMAA